MQIKRIEISWKKMRVVKTKKNVRNRSSYTEKGNFKYLYNNNIDTCLKGIVPDVVLIIYYNNIII